jgi:hypothetical protein
MRKKIILASSFLLAVPLVAYEGGESLACEGQMQVDFAVVSGLKGALLGFLSNVFVSSWSDVLVANLMGGATNFLLQNVIESAVEIHAKELPQKKFPLDAALTQNCTWLGYLVGTMCGRGINRLYQGAWALVVSQKEPHPVPEQYAYQQPEDASGEARYVRSRY